MEQEMQEISKLVKMTDIKIHRTSDVKDVKLVDYKMWGISQLVEHRIQEISKWGKHWICCKILNFVENMTW